MDFSNRTVTRLKTVPFDRQRVVPIASKFQHAWLWQIVFIGEIIYTLFVTFNAKYYKLEPYIYILCFLWLGCTNSVRPVNSNVSPNIFIKITIVFPLHTNMSRCICTEWKASVFSEVSISIQECVSSVCNLLFVTFLAPSFRRCHLLFNYFVHFCLRVLDY